MHSDPYLFAQAILKFLVDSGVGAGIVVALFMEDLARFAEKQRNRKLAVVIRFPRRNELGRSTTPKVACIRVGAERPSTFRRAR